MTSITEHIQKPKLEQEMIHDDDVTETNNFF